MISLSEETILTPGNGVGVRVRGGREIVLRPENGPNALWRNLSGENLADWPNPGGGRTWVSPEADLFFPHLAENGRDDHRVPPEMDPGNFAVEAQAPGTLTLRNDFCAHFWKDGSDLPLILRKKISVPDAPPEELPDGVAFAGYELAVTLTAGRKPSAAQKPAIWNLVQVPPRGVIVLDNGEETCYFGVSAHRVRGRAALLDVPSPGDGYKLGFCPAAGSPVRMCYCSAGPERPYFLIREFRAATRCADIPFPAPPRRACPVQVFCDNGSIGGFAELEYHADYLTAEEPEITDVCRTWAFAGELAKLKTLFLRLFPGAAEAQTEIWNAR